MKAARLDDLVERMHRRVAAEARQVLVDVVLEACACAGTWRSPDVCEIDGRWIDDVGSGLLEFIDRFMKTWMISGSVVSRS